MFSPSIPRNGQLWHPYSLKRSAANSDCVSSLDSSLVMAEQSAHDVVNQTRSVGDRSPSDADDKKSIRNSIGGDSSAGEARPDIQKEDGSEQGGHTFQNGSANRPIINGLLNVWHSFPSLALACAKYSPEQVESPRAQFSSMDTITQTDSNTQDSDFDGNISRNQSVGDLSAASDTENRRAERSSASDDSKGQDAGNTAKRPASFKPVSFAKYSAAKVAGINSVAKAAGDKGDSSWPSYSPLLSHSSIVHLCQFFYLFTTARIQT